MDGALRSIGTSDNPVQILSKQPLGLTDPIGYLNFSASSIGWNGQTGSILENTFLNQTLIYVNSPALKIDLDTINFQGNMMVDNVALRIRAGNTVVTDCIINAAVITEGGSSSITGNHITGGMGLYGGTPTVSNNQVSGGSTTIISQKMKIVCIIQSLLQTFSYNIK